MSISAIFLYGSYEYGRDQFFLPIKKKYYYFDIKSWKKPTSSLIGGISELGGSSAPWDFAEALYSRLSNVKRMITTSINAKIWRLLNRSMTSTFVYYCWTDANGKRLAFNGVQLVTDNTVSVFLFYFWIFKLRCGYKLNLLTKHWQSFKLWLIGII